MPSDATRLKAALGRWALRVVDDASDRMLAFAQQEAPRQTGELAREIRVKNVVQSGTRYGSGLVASTIQAVTTDQGARPHVIRPRRPGGVLRFPSHGAVVFARSVNHPGNRAQRWWAAMHRRRWPTALRTAARRHRL